MKKLLLWCSLCSILIFIQPSDLPAEDYLPKADECYEQGGMEGYQQAIDLYLKILEITPNNYEANWKCARAYREYGNEAKKQAVEGWKKSVQSMAKKA